MDAAVTLFTFASECVLAWQSSACVNARRPPPQAAEECARVVAEDPNFLRIYQRLGSISARPGGLDACFAGIQAVAKVEKDRRARGEGRLRPGARAWRRRGH